MSHLLQTLATQPYTQLPAPLPSYPRVAGDLCPRDASSQVYRASQPLGARIPHPASLDRPLNQGREKKHVLARSASDRKLTESLRESLKGTLVAPHQDLLPKHLLSLDHTQALLLERGGRRGWGYSEVGGYSSFPWAFAQPCRAESEQASQFVLADPLFVLQLLPS